MSSIIFRKCLLRKTLLFLLFFVLLVVLLIILIPRDELCDPKEHLSWFCPWPDPDLTVCKWNEHFPKSVEQLSSPEISNKWLKSLKRIRSLFEFNNKTLVKCSEDSIDLLIFIISKCSHFSIRQSIRRTWGNTQLLNQLYPKLKIKLLFLVDLDKDSREKIELEYHYHHDLVQIINLPEQYEYVTEREAALYQFIQSHCQQMKYLFKTDDDIFLNTYLLLSYLNSQRDQFDQYTLIGYPIEYGLVVRYKADEIGQRYIVTSDEYSCPRYPTFLSGFGYLMSFETLSLLSNAYFIDRKVFPLSDVYFTGLLPEHFHLPRQSFSSNINYRFLSKCTEEFFDENIHSFACAANADHFVSKHSNSDRSLMNDYNLYWTKLSQKYFF